MTRPLPASMIALFLLTSVATAHTECAWVLWSKLMVMSGSPKLPEESLVSAHSTIAACQEALNRQKDRQLGTLKSVEEALAARGQQPPPATATADAVMGAWTDGSILLTSYRCLPDTIAPRGAKGK
jgi:hypothetical protein